MKNRLKKYRRGWSCWRWSFCWESPPSLGADLTCQNAASGKIFRTTETIPPNAVALVLGTGKLTARGNPNLHFTQRIEAAAALFRPAKSSICSSAATTP